MDEGAGLQGGLWGVVRPEAVQGEMVGKSDPCAHLLVTRMKPPLVRGAFAANLVTLKLHSHTCTPNPSKTGRDFILLGSAFLFL